MYWGGGREEKKKGNKHAKRRKGEKTLFIHAEISLSYNCGRKKRKKRLYIYVITSCKILPKPTIYHCGEIKNKIKIKADKKKINIKQ